MASGAFRTLWQSLEQVWLPQGRARPQDLPQGAGFEAWQGQSEVSWPPRQVTGTGASHGGQSVAWTKTLGPLSSHGPAGLEVSSSLIVTLSWQGAAHLCPQPSSLSQGNLQTGHGPEFRVKSQKKICGKLYLSGMGAEPAHHGGNWSGQSKVSYIWEVESSSLGRREPSPWWRHTHIALQLPTDRDNRLLDDTSTCTCDSCS